MNPSTNLPTSNPPNDILNQVADRYEAHATKLREIITGLLELLEESTEGLDKEIEAILNP